MEHRDRYKKKYRMLKFLRPSIFNHVSILVLLSVILTLVTSSEIYALQAGGDEFVSGRVIDGGNNESLPGVNVSVKGTTIGTTTNAEGEYQLNVPSLSDTLVFSFVGFETQTISINGRSVINVTLESETLVGDEMVVVGYGTQSKRDLTGSIAQVNSEDLENQGVVTSVDQMIEGNAAGIQVVQTSGEPGGGVSVNIRGVGSINAGSSPLYVIDGLPIDNSVLISGTGNQVASDPAPRNPLSSLNPEDIKSIEVLKDASATAIYGSRGANGVILITTKQGSPGDLQVDYNGYFGIQNVHNKLNLLSAEQYKREINEIIDSGNLGEWLPSERVGDIQNGGTNWQDEVFSNNAPIQKHNLSFSWGNKNTTYFISLNNTKQQGVVEETSYNRYATRFNLNHNTEKLNVGFNATASYIKDELVPNGFDVNLRGGVINAARQFDPTLSIRTSDGDFALSPYMNIDNPVAITTGNHMEGNRYRYFGTVYGEYFIIPELSVKLKLGADVNNQDKRVYKDRTTIIGDALGGVATLYNGSQSNYLIESTVRYKKTLAEKHQINFVGGITTQKFINAGSNQQGQGFVTDATLANNFGLANPDTYINDSYNRTNSLLSYLARINYTYNDKYLFTGTYRIDGSSRFGGENRFGYFPSISIGWLINEEEFFPFQDLFSQFKIRGSWGQTGNQQIGNNQSILTFGTGVNYTLDDNLVTTLSPSRIANPDLKWETTEQVDIGLDFSLLEDRISGTIDWYRKETFDMLLNLPIPSSTGFNNQRVNVGGMTNEGLEFSITSHNISSQNFSWNTTANLTTVKNEVTNLDDIPQIIGGNSITRPGIPLRSFYGYDVVGIWQKDEAQKAASYGLEPGDFKFRDVNSDGNIDGEDRVALGNSFPDVIGTLSNKLNYKNVQFYIAIQGANGVKMLNRNLLETYFPQFSRRTNKFAEPFLNRWTENNPSNKYPSFIHPGKQSGQSVNSRTVEDASYLKLQTVRISYQIPANALDGILRSAQIYVTGQNLVTLTDYNGFDPAISPNGNSYSRVDWNGYPTSTTFLVGVNLGF